MEVEHCFHSPKQLKFIIGRCRGAGGKRTTATNNNCEAQLDLPALLSTRGMRLSLPLTREGTGVRAGTLEIQGEEMSNTRDIACLYMRARGLPKAGDAALAISALNDRATGWQQVGRTEFVFGTVLGTTEPIWRPMKVPVKHLFGHAEEQLRLDCLLNSPFTGPYSIGHCQVNASEFFKADKDHAFKLRTSDGADAGAVNLLHHHLIKRYSFLDYVSGGCEISVMVAIDFTASNGDPEKRSSLHYVGGGPNQYEMAVRAVAEPLSHYCASKHILAFGYGAEIPLGHSVSHCFALTFDDQRPEAKGVEGLLECYRGALTKVKLRGPTHFAQIGDKAATYAANGPIGGGQSHLVLLIITDGIINDMEETVQQIEEASALPLSILIVGVGDADFTNMDLLCESHPNVKFVAMAEYTDQPPSELSAELLKDVPQQLVGYMHENHLRPVHPPASSLPAVWAGAQRKARSGGGEEEVESEDEEEEEESLLRTEPPQWERDDAATHCTRCQSEFSLLWRRHHCRYCGGIFCDTCSQYSSLLPFSPDPTPQRVCDECYATLVRLHYPCK